MDPDTECKVDPEAILRWQAYLAANGMGPRDKSGDKVNPSPEPSGGGTGPLTGLDATSARLVKTVLRERVLTGDTVIMTGRYTGTCKATGRSMNPQVAHLWTLSGGRAVRFQQLVDTLAVARATGAA